MQAARVCAVRVGQKGVAPEEEHEQLEAVPTLGLGQRQQAVIVAGQIQGRRQVDFKKLFRHRPRAGIIQPPLGSVGQHAPAQRAVGQVVHPSQIAQHLSRWRGLFARSLGAPVQRTLPALGLHHGQTELVALPFLPAAVGACLGRFVGKQHPVRHIIPPARREILLSQTGRPAQGPKHRPDQIVLSLALVGCLVGREAVEDAPQRPLAFVQGRVVKRLPVGELRDGFRQEIVGK